MVVVNQFTFNFKRQIYGGEGVKHGERNCDIYIQGIICSFRVLKLIAEVVAVMKLRQLKLKDREKSKPRSSKFLVKIFLIFLLDFLFYVLLCLVNEYF